MKFPLRSNRPESTVRLSLFRPSALRKRRFLHIHPRQHGNLRDNVARFEELHVQIERNILHFVAREHGFLHFSFGILFRVGQMLGRVITAPSL